MDFTDILRARLKTLGMSHAELAARVNVKPSFVSLVATRRTKVALDPKQVSNIVSTLETRVADLEEIQRQAKQWQLAMQKVRENAAVYRSGASPSDSIALLQSEIERLTAENADLRAQLDEARHD